MVNLNLALVWSFKIVCVIVTFFMVGFWFNEFDKNEDVSQVQYILVKDMEEVIQPEITICISDPLIIEKLQDKVCNGTIEGYLEYLSGNGYDEEEYKNVDFFDVTLDIFDYLQSGATLFWRLLLATSGSTCVLNTPPPSQLPFPH